MAILKKWVCDGCDAETTTAIDAEQSAFYQVKVTAGSWGDDFILCMKCNDRLLADIDPRKWPRCRPAPNAAAA